MQPAAEQQTHLINRLIPPGLILAIAVTYGGALRGPFIFDDYNAILTNDHVKSLWPLSDSMTAQPMSVLVGRPLVCFSFAVNYAIGGFNTFGYHLVNVAIHAACALLLYGLLRRTLLLPRWKGDFQSSAAGFAGGASLLWAVHPLQTEAVSYVTQRTETMESMFLLLTLYSAARAARGAAAWRILAAIACCCGMACKEQMVVAPLLVLLYDWMFLPRDPKRPNARFLMYAALMAAWIILPLELWGADMNSKSGFGLKYVTPWDYLKTQAGVIVHYLRLAFWPRGQALDYFDWPIVKIVAAAVAPGLLVTVLLVATAIACRRRWWPGFLGAWFFLILAPTSSFLPNFTEIAAERRMYLPLASVVVLVLAVAWGAIGRASARAAIILTIAIILGGLTIARNRLYQSGISIWTDAVAKRPGNARAHTFLGLCYADKQDWPHAVIQDNLAIQLSPNFRAALDLQNFIIEKTASPAGANPPGTPP